MGKTVIHLDLTEPGRGIAMIDQGDRPQARYPGAVVKTDREY